MALFQILLNEPTGFGYEDQVYFHFGEFARRTQHPDLTNSIKELYNKFMNQRAFPVLLKLLRVPVVRQALGKII